MAHPEYSGTTKTSEKNKFNEKIYEVIITIIPLLDHDDLGSRKAQHPVCLCR